MNKDNTIRLIDYHCHILKEYFEDPVLTLQELKDSGGLECVVSMGLEYESDCELLTLREEFTDPFLKIGVGLHPSEVIKLGSYARHEYGRIAQLIEERVHAIDYIGEIGIDFTYPDAEKYRDEQVQIFKELCVLARTMSKPVSIHARQAVQEVMEVIDAVGFTCEQVHGFLHSFTGTCDEGIFFLERGFRLGLNGIITFKKSEELRETVRNILDQYPEKQFNELFGLETDTPYLSPEPVRSKKNTPQHIKYIAEFINENILTWERQSCSPDG